MSNVNITTNYDIRYLFVNYKYLLNDLNLDEVTSLLYIAFLLSLYEGNMANRWGYEFSYNKLGGPSSYEILKELNQMVDKGDLKKDNKGYYSSTINKDRTLLFNKIANLKRFYWRNYYIESAVSLCFTNTLPEIKSALYNEPEIKNSRLLKSSNKLYKNNYLDHFKELRNVFNEVKCTNMKKIANIWIKCLYNETFGECNV